MKSVTRFLQEAAALNYRVGEVTDRLGRLEQEVQAHRERLVVIETLIEAGTGRPLPRPGSRR